MIKEQLQDLRVRVVNVLDELKGKNTIRAFDGLQDLLSILDFHLYADAYDRPPESVESIHTRNIADVQSGSLKRFCYQVLDGTASCWFGVPLKDNIRKCLNQGAVVDNLRGRTVCWEHALESGMDSTNSFEQVRGCYSLATGRSKEEEKEECNESFNELEKYIEDLDEKLANFYDKEGFFTEEKVADLIATCLSIISVKERI